MVQFTALEFVVAKLLPCVRYLMACISLPASVPTEAFAWHSVQLRALCLTLLFVAALPDKPWHVEQNESLLAGFASVLLCSLPELWQSVHSGVVARDVWLTMELLKSLT